MELGLDMAADPDPDRRRLMRNIRGAVPWRPGSVTFWPMSRPAPDGPPRPDPEMFWKGVARAKARVVAVFGQPAFAALFPDQPYRHRSIRRDRIQILVLPGPEDMLPDNRQAKKLVWHALNTLNDRFGT
jgi:hypothetical protein